MERALSNQKGQILVEYMLVLVIVIAIAGVLTKNMLDNQDEPGFVLATWSRMLTVIALDQP